MQCVFCKGEIDSYRLAYDVAVIECPHCDMIFSLKPTSRRLAGMAIDIPEPQIFDNSARKMTARGKQALYEKMKKELAENFLMDD